MKRAPYDRRYGQPAASEARRLPVRRSYGARFVCTFVITVIAVCVALVPVSVDAGSAGCPAPGVNVHMNHAHAATVSDPLGCIEEMAEAAGMSAGDFVAVCSGAAASASGMIIARDTGIKMGQSASVNLRNLIDTADYPSWNSLSAESQAVYGSQTNYDAAKFNSLMAAFSLDGVVDGWYQSGGSNFDPDQEALERLQQIGRIGVNWGNGAYNYFSSIKGNDGVVTQPAKLNQWASVNQYGFDGTSYDDWPSEIPVDLNYGIGSRGWILRDYNNGYYFIQQSSSSVYIVCYRYKTTGDNYYSGFYLFSKTPFSYGYYLGSDPNGAAVINQTTSEKHVNGHTLYKGGNSYGGTDEILSSFPAYNVFGGNYSNADVDYIGEKILYNYAPGYSQPMADYPTAGDGGVASDTPVYMPSDGVKPGQSWNAYITQPEQPPEPNVRPENPYNPTNPENPQYQSGTPEWKQDTAANLDQALHINFEKLFPFCLIYDLKMFVDKFRELVLEDTTGLGEQAINDYEILRLPGLPIDGLEDGMEFDLEPLRNLLNLIRPIVFWVLLVYMLMSIIEFWRGILTGGD